MAHKITVVMPAYNAARHISQALDSIFRSSEQSFDILICDDGSTDNTCEIIERYQRKYSSITLIKNTTNQGAGYTRAKLIRLVTTDLVAFCDADDIIHPDRFRKQIEYLNAHPDVSVLGSMMQVFYDDDIHNTGNVWSCLEHDADIKTQLLFNCAAYTPSVMMRTQAIRKTGIEFHTNLRMAEDYDYWVRLVPFVNFANIQEVLVLYRRHEAQLTNKNTHSADLIANHIKAAQKMCVYYGINLSADTLRVVCFPQYSLPLSTSRHTRIELKALINRLVRNTFRIPLSDWPRESLLMRLFPYVLSLRCFVVFIRGYRSIKQKNPTVLNIIKFYALVILMPLFVSGTVRACWWYMIHRVRFKRLRL